GFDAQVFDFSSDQIGVERIRLTVAQGDTGTGQTAGGFDEVAFSSIPEPSAALLGGLGLLALLRRRRA
ncbi:MAG TPA: PEP-CTERM sorting domain-containing protein, partial [Luteolibacter sp.]